LKLPAEANQAGADLTEEDLALLKQGVGDKSPRTGFSEPGASPEEGGPYVSGEQMGTIVKYFQEKGFGFIRPETGGKDVFFHVTRVREGVPEDLMPGRKVVFEVDYDRTGKMQATNLRILPD
jgi:cold shock CspA family protein